MKDINRLNWSEMECTDNNYCFDEKKPIEINNF